MLLQTNSYVVPKEKRSEHARLVRRFKQCLSRLGCEDYEVYEQVGNNWTSDQTGGRFVQIMRFRDRRHQLAVQAAEKNDAAAQAIIAEFCDMVNFPYQQQQGLFAVGFYTSLLAATQKALPHEPATPAPPAQASPPDAAAAAETPEPGLPITEFAEAPPIQDLSVAELAVEANSDISLFAEKPPLSQEQPVELGAAKTEHVETGRNGDSIEHAAAALEPPVEHPTEIGVAALEELIKQRFGSIETAPPAEPSAAEPQAREAQAPEAQPSDPHIEEPQVSEPIFSNSGISEVLDASLGDDPDLEINLPPELLGPTTEEKVHPEHERSPEASHAERNRS